jgi:endo-1,4-beta-xylanase
MKRRALLAGSIASAMCSSVNWLSPLPSTSTPVESLRAAAISKSTLAGTDVSNEQLRDPRIAAFVREQCNFLSPEDQMQWSQVHPELDRYNFAAPDELLAFAQTNSLPLHGRTLCQNLELPPWVKKEASTDNASQLLRGHVETMVGRYAGRIYSWDVLSDAVEPGDKRDDGMRNSTWMKLLGLQYIAIAFRAAAETDHKAILTYNERGLVDDSQSSHDRRLIALGFLRWFRTNRIPIHALGLHSHLRARYDYLPNWVHLHAFLREVEKLELQVFITELEIDDTDLSIKPELREKQVAELCGDFLSNMLKHSNVTVVLTAQPTSHVAEETDFFGVTEKRHMALPLNEDRQPTTFLSAMTEAVEKRRIASR